mmetsp:Transcript_25680/g.59194  ORF Transcript_25680/g.59194 Transcript_25680/m.59194 type:complete len:332 (-) Transcript_25680:135-1130(-)
MHGWRNFQIWEIDGAEGGAVDEVLENAPGDLETDGLLRFQRGPAHVRRQDGVGAAPQRRLESRPVNERLGREHVDHGASEVAGLEAGGECRDVDALAASQVEEVRAGLHECKLALADHVLGDRGEWDMQRHKVGGLQESVQIRDGGSVAKHELGLMIIYNNAHAERLSEKRHLRAHMAVTNNTQRLAADLIAASRGLAPFTSVHLHIAIGHLAGEVDDVSDGNLGDTASVAVGSVEHRNALLARLLQVHLVRADAKTPHSHEQRSLAEDSSSDLGLTAHANHVVLGNGRHEILFRHPLHAIDCESLLLQKLDALRMHSFQQQNFDILALDV